MRLGSGPGVHGLDPPLEADLPIAAGARISCCPSTPARAAPASDHPRRVPVRIPSIHTHRGQEKGNGDPRRKCFVTSRNCLAIVIRASHVDGDPKTDLVSCRCRCALG